MAKLVPSLGYAQAICRRLLIPLMALVASPGLVAFDSQDSIDRAVQLIEAGQQTLARTYLEPALIDQRLEPGQRSRAYYLRGYSFFSQGLYVSASKDYNRALEFYPDNPIVLSAVGHLHFEGLGVQRDQALAAELFRKSAEAGYAPAQTRLGHSYLVGAGVDKDLAEARRWLEAAAETGEALAMQQLATSYRAPYAQPPDPDAALRWYERAWEAGDADARAYIGFMVEGGELPSPPGTALSYFEQAADAGSALAQAKLGHMYLSGETGEPDPDRARSLFAAAAAQGHPAGYLGMAYLYDSGTGVDADPEAALGWYRQAAEAGSRDAQMRLAYLALRSKDLAGQREAARWLERAASGDNPQAWNDYAWLLATSPFQEVRQGMRAVALAERAAARQRTPVYLDTLAAAYAEAGDFEKAVTIQQEALSLVTDDQAALVAELRAHLAAFEARKPWRE